MKELVNLIFANTERLLWFRHLLWTLRKTDNEPCGIGYYSSKYFDVINEDTQKWLRQHRNDYLDTGKTTGTENSTDVTEEKS